MGNTQTARLVEIFERNIDDPKNPFTVVNKYVLESQKDDEFIGVISAGTTNLLITFTNISSYVVDWTFVNGGLGDLTYKFENITNPSHSLLNSETHEWDSFVATRCYISNNSVKNTNLRIVVRGL